MDKFDVFVLPFTIGLAILAVILLAKYITWIKNLSAEDKLKVKKGFFSLKSFQAIGEVFNESLLHRKIFRVNPILGYMHASLAFGWFLLIVIGNFESRIFYNGHISPPYIPIFFRFFNPNPENFQYHGIFAFIMDLLLAVLLSGIVLAWFKRMYSKFFGLKKTTKLHLADKLALTSLWTIFPLRFLAESFTSANYGGGHFLTSNAGNLFAGFLPTNVLAYPTWWAYSVSLGLFFVALPFSRYMHIPTEVLLIFLRKYGIKENNNASGFTKVELNSCSRCGICIDTCQLASSANIKHVQSVYYLKNLRYGQPSTDQSLNCLMCGRCDNICPVGIDIQSIRLAGRQADAMHKTGVYGYIPETKVPRADVLYFAGCMTHLQPGIKKAMVEILKAASVNFRFLDENGSICCGRPQMLAGNVAKAQELMEENKKIIQKSGAKTLVTSCPICYKVFKESYRLDIEILHHSEYLLRLIDEEKIQVNRQGITAVYHDPCELGRGSGIYNQPRKVLSGTLQLQSTETEKEKALCCGGSLANIKISNTERKKITADAIQVLTVNNPDVLITSCPLCKKTFSQSAPVQVLDIAEIVSKSLIRKDYFLDIKVKTSKIIEIAEIEEKMG
jgi:Fe-S oxidoreductase